MTTSATGEEAAAAYWADFSTAQSPEQFYFSWLGILCTQIERVTGGLLLIASAQENTFALGAVWPDASRDMSHLGPVAQQALTERRGVVIPHAGAHGPGPGGAFVAYPVEVAGVLRGAVVLDTAARPEPDLQMPCAWCIGRSPGWSICSASRWVRRPSRPRRVWPWPMPWW